VDSFNLEVEISPKFRTPRKSTAEAAARPPWLTPEIVKNKDSPLSRTKKRGKSIKNLKF